MCTGGQSQIIGAAIAFREARARAAFQTFEPVAVRQRPRDDV
jgi:hypothetical protein